MSIHQSAPEAAAFGKRPDDGLGALEVLVRLRLPNAAGRLGSDGQEEGGGRRPPGSVSSPGDLEGRRMNDILTRLQGDWKEFPRGRILP